MYETQVLVIGAGPTGLALATSLVARGIATTVVDRAPEGANTSRAAVVNARTLEVLEPLDVTRRLVKEGVEAPLFTIRDRGRTLIPIDFSGLPTKYPYSLMVPQSTTERLLLDRLVELGGSVIRPKTVTAITQDGDGVTAMFDDGDTIRARYAVGADGIRSVVREQAGIGFEGAVYDESFMLADVRLTGDAPDGEVLLFWAKAGLTVVAPLPDGVHRIVAPVAEAPEQPSAEFVQQILDTRVGAGRMVVTDVVWGSRFRVHHRVADTFRAGRLLLAGDAAHVHSPAGGQGMNLGIQDAVALADALVAVLGGAPDSVLDDYVAVRRPIAKDVVAMTDRLTRLATLPRAARRVRNAAISVLGWVPSVRLALARRLSGLVYR
ncbi:pentachlorophenol monooxygenase [Mycolicibacterium moriokaense]|jgi:2-polyprenyl-6-methoxyphenol hydroxylase-like FAD-dependent oxidoreductase|uniref:Pentachlorophenol monooxygenase n=1 Tax=Mycolicibacterium moriokaense TaxID=39691 RepID=A0AAD1HAW3_9MYCO|nr:FAD-dependent oxidoreductase [Mycolicibacterium moriokaense]MCV7041004.1 FAD-dependent monooxygenase [Mycolicibacterium moriokaense]ORB27372.1 pentachlorophenol monooxygenase [Mycolicibacterium moriokaense]BBX00563.1 pentachlorophenol monooxygenase [Mycolicibacterium moriokaense]